MRSFLARKNVVFSLQRYGIEAMGAMALGLFSSLLVGLILKVLGTHLHIPFFQELGGRAMAMVGPAIGVAVAYGLQAPPLVLFASTVTGMAGYELGGPAGCFVAVIIGVEFGKLISGETKADIIVTPFVTLAAGVLAAMAAGPAVGSFMTWLGSVVMTVTEMHPIPMGVLLAVIVGMTLTLPISSAALCIMLGLGGLAAGAATVGCSAQMIGFAVASYRENGWGGLISQGLGTSMLQIPNIIKNPLIWIPPTLTGALLGPLATTVLPMKNVPSGAGMGTSGLVGQFGTFEAMGGGGAVLLKILLLHFVLPALLTLFFAEFMRRRGWIKPGDMELVSPRRSLATGNKKPDEA